MTTDNRTNEPTPEQVEAAAEVLRQITNEPRVGRFERTMARAALEAAARAAQGAAPQAEVLPETGNELRDEDGDLISSGKHLRILQQGMYVCDTCTNSLGLNVRWDHAIKRDDHAPVLQSSGVDEDKLAEVIGRHKLVHVAVSRKSAFCACNPSVTAGVDDNRAWFEGHRARAVAEWLKGQGR